MKRYQTDPSYAAAVFDEIGPSRLLDLPLDIQSNFSSSTSREAAGNTRDAESELATILGHLLATRSQGWDDKEAKNYADRLTFYAEEKNKGARIESLNKILSASRQQDIDGDGSNETVGLDYNDAFLMELAKKLEKFNPKGGHDGRQSVLEESNALEGVVHAMTGNLDVATNWITIRSGDGTVNAEETAKRTQSLINKASRDGKIVSGSWSDQWQDDWLMLSAEESIQGVQDANNGVAQAAITSGVLNTIGTRENSVKLSDAARNSAAITLSNYVYGMQMSAKPDGAAGWTIDVDKKGWSENMPSQPVIGHQALSNLLGQVGMNDYATARLAGVQEAFNKQQISDAKGSDEVDITSILKDQSNLRGFTSGAIARQSEIESANSDARVGAWANAVSTAMNAVPVPQVKAGGAVLKVGTQFALNAGKSAASQGADNAINYLGAHKEERKKSQNQRTREVSSAANTDITTLTLLQSGTYTQQELADIHKDNEGIAIKKVIDANGVVQIDANKSNPNFDDDQKNALRHIASTLPVDNHPGMQGFGDGMRHSFGDGYEVAYGQEK